MALDRETKDFHTLTVIAKDGGLVPFKSEVMVHITVTDINDHRPVFSQRHYQATLVEQQPAQTILVLTVRLVTEDRAGGGERKLGTITIGADFAEGSFNLERSANSHFFYFPLDNQFFLKLFIRNFYWLISPKMLLTV